MGCMAMTGNDIPEMLKEITPQSEANESPIRRVGSIVNINTPSPWQAKTNRAMMLHIRGRPQLHGKWR